ncbi:MAG TPA: hypothetical protein VI461_03790 [Chitinophagaceae bacterium]|nr:hypothetical protein [Chitinophagaceae bacterium]
MKIKFYILYLLFAASLSSLSLKAQDNFASLRFDFYGDTINLPLDSSLIINFNDPLSDQSIKAFNDKISSSGYQPLIKELLSSKTRLNLDDWLYYQLIRKTAQQISPKAENYSRYTLYKWFLLTRSGYDAFLTITGDSILFYVQSNENIYNIPFRIKDGKQYVCLNYHDYRSSIDFEKEKFREVAIPVPEAHSAFSYKVRNLPHFRSGDYLEKDIRFSYNESEYYYKVKLNPEIKTIFANYPVVDYESYFNIPLSNETYRSLIPLLKKTVKGLNTKNGVDFLMRFTRYAFLFETDTKVFGAEKRLTPEQTLLYNQSDCDDRAALFFYLVKEIYNLPMIVLTFPTHVTVAVKLDKPAGKTILYNGEKYTVCEPTPQKEDLLIGEWLPRLRNSSYEIVYAYNPIGK